VVHALVVVDAGVWLKDEPVTRSRLLGAVLGLIGVVVLIGPSALGSCRVDGGFFDGICVHLVLPASGILRRDQCDSRYFIDSRNRDPARRADS